MMPLQLPIVSAILYLKYTCEAAAIEILMTTAHFILSH